jgi:uncharacterized membrane protein YqjE
MTEEGKGSGLLANTSRLASTLLESARTRIELLGLEIAEERQRFVLLLILGGLSLILFFAGLMTFVLLVTFLFWDQRVGVVSVLALLFLGAAVFLAWKAWRCATHQPHPFETSMEELAEDIQRLKAAAQDEPSS